MVDIIDSEKSLYLIQLQYLEEQLERYQLKYVELEKQKKDLASQHSTLLKEKKDSSEFLKRSLVAKKKKAVELVEQIASQYQAAEQDKEDLKLCHSQSMKELREQIEELHLENKKLEAECKTLKELQEALMVLVSKADSLREQLHREKEELQSALDIQKNKMETEAERLVAEALFRSDRIVHMLTSETVQKGRAHHSKLMKHLTFLRNETLTVEKERDVLVVKDRELRSERDDMKKNLEKIKKESFTYKTEVQQLRKTCKQLAVELDEQKNAQKKAENLGPCPVSQSKQNCQKAAEVSQLRTKLQRESNRGRQLEGVMQEAVIILSHILMDPEKTSETEWKLLRLLEILESTAPQGPGSALDSPAKESGRGQKPQPQ